MVLFSPDGVTDPVPEESNSKSHTPCFGFESVTAVTVTISVLWLVTSCVSAQAGLPTFRMLMFPPC